MAARRYPRRNRLSRSVERPAVATGSQSDSDDNEGDVSMSTPFAVATGTSVPGTPTQEAPVGSPSVRTDTPSIERAVAAAAALTSPARKQRRVMGSDALPDVRPFELGAETAAAAPQLTPQRAADAGAGDVAEVERVADAVIRKLRGEFKPTERAEHSCKEMDTEELTAELIRRARQTEPRTATEWRQRQRERGLEAFDAICDIARELQGNQPAAAANAAALGSTSNATAVEALQTVADAAREVHGAPPPLSSLPPVRRAGEMTAVQSQTSTTAAGTDSVQSINTSTAPIDRTIGPIDKAAERAVVPSYCTGKLPRLLLPDDDESDARPAHYGSTVRMQIPTFDGNNWAAFKSVFESIAKHYRWSDEIKALQLKCCIKGDARAALGVVESIDWTYGQLVEHMELRHGRHKTKTEVMNELDKLYRKPGQSLTQWRDEVISVANTGALTPDQWKRYTHHSFLKGLGTYGQMQSWVGEHDDLETLASCYDWAKRYEREIGVPTYTARASVKLASHTATASTMAVDMVTPVDVTAQTSGAVRQVEAAPSENLADALDSMRQKIKKIEKATYRGRGRGGRGRGGRGRGNGWRFGNNNDGEARNSNNSQNNNNGRQNNADAHDAQGSNKSE